MSNEKKQTAVEWLKSEMLKPNLSMINILEKAKQLEKQQIMDAYNKAWDEGHTFEYDNDCNNEGYAITGGDAEEYYTQKYGK
jgi:hypothetical protein